MQGMNTNNIITFVNIVFFTFALQIQFLSIIKDVTTMS
jgi:hypothetical protein